MEALIANPQAFFWHIQINCKNLLAPALLLITPHPIFAGFEVRLFAEIIVSLLLAAGSILSILHARRDERGLRLVLLSSAFFLPFIMSTLLIAPRHHYFMAPLAILSVLASYGLSGVRFSLSAWWVCIIPLPLILMIGALSEHSPKDALVISQVRAIKALQLPAQGAILEADFGRAVYAGLDYSAINLEKCVPFDNCLRSNRPEIIVSDESLRSRYSDDVSFLSFTKNPTRFGYDVVSIAGTRTEIYSVSSIKPAQREAAPTF